MLLPLPFLMYQKTVVAKVCFNFNFDANLEDRITSGAPVSSTAKVGIPRKFICKQVELSPFNSFVVECKFWSPS